MIEIRNLSHSLSDNTILENVNLTLPEGRVMGLVGINGAGKTTLLRLMAGVYSCRSGEILCDGENIKKESAREKIFFLPDDPYFTVHTTGKSLFDMYKVFYPSMEYSVFNGGKRIRSILCIETARMLSGSIDKALPFATAIEFIHAFSLIHDDLPCMDNADLRRGMPSCHKKYGEAIALLAGDALLNTAFEVMIKECEKLVEEVLQFSSDKEVEKRLKQFISTLSALAI